MNPVARTAALCSAAFLAAVPALAGQRASDSAFTSLAAALRDPGRVKTLTLRQPMGSLPPGIAAMVNLETLILDRTDLPALSDVLARLPRLRTLYLGGNPRLDFAKVLTQLAGCPALERLGIDDNDLGHVPPEIGGLVRLRALSLSKDQLTSLPPELGRLTRLETLDLFQNEFSDLPDFLTRLPRLRIVYVSGNLMDSDKATRFERRSGHATVSWRIPDEPYFH